MANVGGDGWYENAATYWEKVEPTVNGMLGGFELLTDIDCAASLKFVEPFVSNGLGTSLACDCGAGIGRVSKNFLLKVFERVDLVEQNGNFLQESHAYMGASAVRVDHRLAIGLQEFEPSEQRYDLIWSQWVLGHLTDDHLVSFFKRCKTGLKPNGLIGVKENITASGFVIDEEDNSVTRSDAILKTIFRKAGLRVLTEQRQQGFPEKLFGVKMYMLQPM
ncbi:N-terminal Xaa-Pro-Lys N-methyltransferase 1 [Nowakowskiella sp. JEL0078]|nr:N-terminal Xaa-Pro-Lys N-methyltransferase 1 [Nowakowskiella sp. JEL0078]